tara:strand:- start:757 stop:1290 length:534 start_codon:yes stop_codon:yes gene_type:complete
MASKDILRRKFSLIRKKRYFEVKNKFFLPILKIISKNNFKRIAIYYPSNYELNTLELFKLLGKKKKISTLLPSISGKSMKFFKWDLSQPLKVNNFGFLDPISPKKNIIPDLILVPLLAFDKSKNRLGYGKGYYDNFLKKNKKVTTIGIAFSFQKYNRIKTSSHDVKLEYILTEKGII